MAQAPVAPAPAAPAAAGTTPAAPRSLAEVQRGIKSLQGRAVEGPTDGQGFVRVRGKPVGGVKPKAPVAPDMAAKPTAGEKAGAPVAAKPEAPAKAEVQVTPNEDASAVPAPQEASAPDAEPAAKPDAMAELKKGFDAKSRELAAVKKDLMELETMAKGDFKALVLKLADHYKADPQQVAEALLLERAQKWEEEQRLSQMSPEQREYHELKKAHEARLAEEKTAGERKAAEAREAGARHAYDTTTAKMIEAHKLLPESIRNHPEFNGKAALRVRDALMARAMLADPAMPIDEFLAGINPAELAKEAWSEYKAELRQAALAMDDAETDELFTPEMAGRWTKKLQAAAVKKAHPSLTAQPRAGDGKFVAGSAKPDPKPLSAMKPSWSGFLPKKTSGR